MCFKKPSPSEAGNNNRQCLWDTRSVPGTVWSTWHGLTDILQQFPSVAKAAKALLSGCPSQSQWAAWQFNDPWQAGLWFEPKQPLLQHLCFWGLHSCPLDWLTMTMSTSLPQKFPLLSIIPSVLKSILGFDWKRKDKLLPQTKSAGKIEAVSCRHRTLTIGS